MAELRQRKPSTSSSNGTSSTKTNGSSPAKAQNGSPKKQSGISESMNKLLGFVVLAMTLGLLFRENINHFVTDSFLGGKPPRLPADIAKRDAIVDAFKHAYNAYETHAFGSDTYHPLTQKGSNLTSSGGIGAFIASSLPTIQIMGLAPEYGRARNWIDENLEWEGKNGDVNAYQVTSQVLGGLLSSYALTGDKMYLEKAEDLATRLSPIFEADSPFGIPQSKVNLGKKEAVVDENHIAVTNEAMGVQVEWRYLAELMVKEGKEGKGKEWREKVEKVTKRIKENPLASGQASLFIAIEAGKFMTSQTRIGYRGDNFYSYLLKQHLQSCPSSSSPPSSSIYAEMYQTYITTIQDTLIGKSLGKGLTYIKELTPKAGRRGYMNWYTVAKQDQISCFLGGTLLLGSQTPGVGLNSTSGEMTERGKKDWELGKELIETCVDFWRGTKTGLAPEVVKFRTPDDGLGAHGGKSDWFIETSPSSASTPHPPASYQLRSETIESLFYAWRLTGDERYREYGWEIFQAIEKYTKLEKEGGEEGKGGGYASLSNVENGKSRKEDRMESYFLSETLKYLYLLFSDSDTIPLERYVFTSHGQPLPKFGEGCRK